MQENQWVIKCEHLGKVVSSPAGEISILKDVSFSVQQGETVAVVGTSGSGKTTLLSILAGLDVGSEGQVMLAGENIQSLDEDRRAQLRNRHIGFVFQSFHLLPGFSALENVMLPLEINQRADAEEVATRLLLQVGMQHRLHHYATTLSGGEQQRVAIARAFAMSPPLVLADEPTGSLDVETGARIIDLLFAVNAEAGTTLVMVTHDVALSRRCQHRYRLQDGQLEKLPGESE